MFPCMLLILCPKFYVDLCSAVKPSSCTSTDISLVLLYWRFLKTKNYFDILLGLMMLE